MLKKHLQKQNMHIKVPQRRLMFGRVAVMGFFCSYILLRKWIRVVRAVNTPCREDLKLSREFLQD